MSGLTSRIVKAPWIAIAVATTLVGCVAAPEPSGLACTPDAGLSGEGSAIAACPNFPWEGVPVPVDSPLNVVGGALLPDPAASPANEPLVWSEADPDRPNHLGAAGCGCDPVDLPNMAGDLLLGFNAVANGSPLRTFDGRPAIAWHDHRTAIAIRPVGCDPARTVCGPPQRVGRFRRQVRTNASLSRVGQHPPAPVCVAQVGDELHDRCAMFSPGCQTSLQHDPRTGQALYSARTPACIVTVDEEFACDADCSPGFGREVQRLADLLAQQRQLQAVNAAGATPMPVSIPLGPNQQVASYLDNTLVQPLQAYTPVQEAFIRLCGDRARAQRTLPDNDVDGVCDGGQTPGGWFAVDNCPDHANPAQADGDHDAVGDACDNCPVTANAEQHDHFGRQPDGTPCPLEAAGCTADETGDACGDVDTDGVLDGTDNCPLHSNAEQADLDGDGQGDPCDPDRDGDGVPEPQDNCPEVANADQQDFDEDGTGDACDDSDDDGTLDANDNCRAWANPGQRDSDGDGLGDDCDCLESADVASGDGDTCNLPDGRLGMKTCVTPANVQRLEDHGLPTVAIVGHCLPDGELDRCACESILTVATDPEVPQPYRFPAGDLRVGPPEDMSGTVLGEAQTQAVGEALVNALSYTDFVPRYVFDDGEDPEIAEPLVPADLHTHLTELRLNQDLFALSFIDVWADPLGGIGFRGDPLIEDLDDLENLRRRLDREYGRPSRANRPTQVQVNNRVARLTGLGLGLFLELAMGAVAEISEVVQQKADRITRAANGYRYEYLMKNLYCDSAAHRRAAVAAQRNPDEACLLEYTVPRYQAAEDQLLPENQLLVESDGRLRVRRDAEGHMLPGIAHQVRYTRQNGTEVSYIIFRKRRIDCHCPAIPEDELPEGSKHMAVPAISEEYKYNTPGYAKYSASYETDLIKQCRNMRLHNTLENMDAYPRLGASLPEAVSRVNQTVVGGRPYVAYRTRSPSQALRRVLQGDDRPDAFTWGCRFQNVLPQVSGGEPPPSTWDQGVLPEAEAVAALPAGTSSLHRWIIFDPASAFRIAHAGEPAPPACPDGHPITLEGIGCLQGGLVVQPVDGEIPPCVGDDIPVVWFACVAPAGMRFLAAVERPALLNHPWLATFAPELPGIACPARGYDQALAEADEAMTQAQHQLSLIQTHLHRDQFDPFGQNSNARDVQLGLVAGEKLNIHAAVGLPLETVSWPTRNQPQHDVPWLSKTEPGVYLTMFNPLYFREMQGAWSIFDRWNGAAQQEQYQEWRGDDDTRIAIDDGEARDLCID